MKLRVWMGFALGAACVVASLGALYAELAVEPQRPEHVNTPAARRPSGSRVGAQPESALLFHASARPRSRPATAQKSASSVEPPPTMPELAKNLTEPLKARWQREPKDAKWAGLEREIETFFHDPRLSGITFVSADCRTTLCRYEIALSEADAFRNMLDVAQVARPFAGAVGVPALDGDRLTVFLAPPGVPLLGEPARPELIERVRRHFRIAPS
jgi:hypothetical protein